MREVLSNATMAHSTMNLDVDTREIVKNIFKILDEDKDGIIKANEIDVENNNGFSLEFEIINNMRDELSKIDDEYRKVLSMQKDLKNNFMIGKQTDKIGTICLAYEGNTYSLLELAIKAILSHNALIISSKSDYMKATNELIVILIKRILKAHGVNENLIQLFYAPNFEELLSNTISITKVIAIGNKEFQNEIKSISKIPVICKGYDNYEIYIEDLTNIDTVKKIIDKATNVDIYAKTGLRVPFDDYMEVNDIDEAIAQINFNTSGYSASIFTDNPQSGSQFLREAKTENVYVNSSPLKYLYNSIEMSDLTILKQMYYPDSLNEELKDSNFEFPTSNAVAKKIIESKSNSVKMELAECNKKKELLFAQVQEQKNEIDNLKRRLGESQSLVIKYTDMLKNSFLSRFFAKIKKDELEKDVKLLS